MHHHHKLIVFPLFMIGVLLAGSAFAEQRTWRDRSGKFSIEAELVDVDSEKVTLRTADDKQVTVALAKLCEDDRKYLEELNAVKDEEKGVRLTVTRFFNALRKGEETRDKEIRETITVKSREKMEGSGSEIKNLAKPDRSTKPAIRTVSIDGDTAEATVRMRLHGKSILPRVLLRKEDDMWLVYGLVGPNQDEEETTILFEDTDANSNARELTSDGDAGVDSDGEAMDRDVEVVRTADQPHPEERARAAAKDQDPFAVPDGENAQALMEFIEKTLASKPKPGSDEGDHAKKVALAVETAANKVIADHGANAEHKNHAAEHLTSALLTLYQSEPDVYSERLSELAEELARRDLPGAVPHAQSAVLFVKLAKVRDNSDETAVNEVVDEAVAHLQAAPLTDVAVQLAQLATELSATVNDSFAAKTYAAAADALAKSEEEETRELAEAMLATSRLLGLVGSEMVVKGVSPRGEAFNFADYEGKVVLVNFWATFSDPSREELAGIKAQYNKYRERGLEVVAISVDNHMEALFGYLRKEKPPWTVLADFHSKNPESVSELYGIETLPRTILIGDDGKVITVQATGEKLAHHLEEIFGDEA